MKKFKAIGSLWPGVPQKKKRKINLTDSNEMLKLRGVREVQQKKKKNNEVCFKE